MATHAEIGAVYAGGVVQGIVLVTFPATSAIFTSHDFYALNNMQYGGMFVPQAITAILASLLGAGLARKLGGKSMLLAGLVADLISMALLFASQFLIGTEGAYVMLLAATTCLGVGFGLVVPAINTFTATFFPATVDRAILGLNALLGLGTALAPVFAAIFVGLGFWWGLPLLMAVAVLALLLFTLRLPLQDPPAEILEGAPAAHGIPPRFWLYALFALLYGVGETMNGNWGTVYMSSVVGASTTLSALALTVFWVMVTVGRMLFAAIEKWLPERWTYRLLPIVLTVALVAIAAVPKDNVIFGIACFGLAGLGCSALLPLVISFAQGELTTMRAAVAGSMIGFYQMGYGVAAFGVGPLQSSAGWGLVDVYRSTAAVTAAMTIVAFLLTARKIA